MEGERDGVDQFIEVAQSSSRGLTEVLTLGLLVARKWDRARSAYPDLSAAVTAADAAQFDNFTAAEMREFRDAAGRMLAEYAATLPREADSWWRGFWQGLASAWAYALSIAVVAFIIKLSGSDLLTLLRELFVEQK